MRVHMSAPIKQCDKAGRVCEPKAAIRAGRGRFVTPHSKLLHIQVDQRLGAPANLPAAPKDELYDNGDPLPRAAYQAVAPPPCCPFKRFHKQGTKDLGHVVPRTSLGLMEAEGGVTM